jgi:uncharacterized damage-inducible protein DinB
MIAMIHASRQCAWADDRFLTDLAELPDEVLRAEYAPGEWDVARTISHWVGSTTWYRYCLGLGPEEEQPVPSTMAGVESLRQTLAIFNASLVAEAEKEDEVMTVIDGDSTFEIRRSSVLLQVVAHAIEHRTQIACALETTGHRLDLMRYSVWGWR